MFRRKTTPRQFEQLTAALRKRPVAVADVRGSSRSPHITGQVRFYQTPRGVLVAVEIDGLPTTPGRCGSGVFGLHIHGGSSCTGNEDDPFAGALSHYDPGRCPHPHHGGDLPPLFENDGYAFQVVLTDRFRAEEIMGKTVIVHAAPDDFTTQPAGDAGQKLACGPIRPYGKP